MYAELAKPFESIDSAHEFVALLEGSIQEAVGDVREHLRDAEGAGASVGAVARLDENRRAWQTCLAALYPRASAPPILTWHRTAGGDLSPGRSSADWRREREPAAPGGPPS